MTLTNAYPSREEAGLAEDVLREYGIRTTMTTVDDYSDDPPITWFEVTIVELPQEWRHAGYVVGRGSSPSPSAPSVEPNEHDRGASSWWDDEGPGRHVY